MTLTALTVGCVADNRLVDVLIMSADNAVVVLGDGRTSRFGLKVPLGGVAQYAFVIRRERRDRAATVHFVVRDLCGDWPSFAGMGTGVR